MPKAKNAYVNKQITETQVTSYSNMVENKVHQRTPHFPAIAQQAQLQIGIF